MPEKYTDFNSRSWSLPPSCIFNFENVSRTKEHELFGTLFVRFCCQVIKMYLTYRLKSYTLWDFVSSDSPRERKLENVFELISFSREIRGTGYFRSRDNWYLRDRAGTTFVIYLNRSFSFRRLSKAPRRFRRRRIAPGGWEGTENNYGSE